MSPMQRAQRFRDVEAAIAAGDGVTQLAALWGVSKAAVSQWCSENIDPHDRRAMRANGNANRAAKLRQFDLGARIELIAACRSAGMTWERIGDAIGCAASAVWLLAARHAPDGLDSALEDFREEDEAA